MACREGVDRQPVTYCKGNGRTEARSLTSAESLLRPRYCVTICVRPIPPLPLDPCPWHKPGEAMIGYRTRCNLQQAQLGAESASACPNDQLDITPSIPRVTAFDGRACSKSDRTLPGGAVIGGAFPPLRCPIVPVLSCPIYRAIAATVCFVN